MRAEGTVLLTILIGLDAGGVAVHHEADGAGGSEDGDLRVAEAVLLALDEGGVPAIARGLDKGVQVGDVEGFGTCPRGADLVDLGAMHADDVEKGLAVDVEAGAGATFLFGFLADGSGGGEWRAGFGDEGGLEVGVAAEDGGEGGGEVAAGVRVVGQAEGHEQGAEVGIAEAERAVVVRVLGDHLGGIAGGVDDDLHGSGDDGDGVTVGGDIKLAAGRDELEEVEGGEIAGGVVEEHVLGAGVGGVDAGGVFAGVPLVDGGVVLHAGVAAGPGVFGDLAHEIAGGEGGDGSAGFLDSFSGEVGVALDGGHELVIDAHGVVGVLEEDAGVGFGVRAGAVVSGGDQGVGLGLFLGLALDEVDDVGVIDVENDHLGGAAGFAAGFDDAGEGVKATHEGERAGGRAAAGEGLHASANGGEIGTGAGTPLEEHALGLGEGKDGVERILHGVDEAGGALGLGVAGGGEGDLTFFCVPVPVLRVGVGFEAVAADVEPDGGVEGDLLVEQEVDELGVEGFGVFGGGEVAVADAPIADGLGDAGDEGADAELTLRRADEAVEIL